MVKNLIYYLGPKQTNISYSNFFDGSITLFGENENNNYSYEKDFCFEYWNENNIYKRILIYNSLLNNIKGKCNVMLHDQYLDSLCTFPDNIKKTCCNDFELLKQLNNKREVHKLLNNLVPMLKYQYLNISEISGDIFRNNIDLVFQKENLMKDLHNQKL